ncbi:F-actin-capping protein subunit alpha [Coemansia sp. Benny D115]|nr:F-actin-capping protein subunit alpha [Coemansia sp. Benny D115]
MTNSTDLQSLLKRLEKATARLEEMATKRAEQKASGSTGASASASSGSEGKADLGAEAGADSKPVLEYESMVKPYVTKYVEVSKQIGGFVGEQAQLIESLYNAQRNFIRVAGLTKKPAASQLPDLVSAQQELIQQVIAIKDKNRPYELFDNLSAVAEGIAAFGWVVVEPTPVPYINDMKDSAQFYANRVLRAWKEKDEKQVEWVKALLSVLRELAAYVKQFHTTGLVWNPKGEDPAKALQALKSGSSAPAAPAPAPSGGAPPPPPPPPPPVFDSESNKDTNTASLGGSASRGALFAEINKGNAVTGGLRKVDKSEMTHKNPNLRASSVVQGGSSHSSTKPNTQSAPKAQQQPPRMELQGLKWVVENYGTEHLTIEATETKQTVYMYNCKGTTLEVKNKLNGIAIDNCQKCGIIFDSLVAQCEIINSKSVQVQARESVPSIQIDRTDGAHVFLSETARDNTQITTAKASEVNISFPYETSNPDDDNFVEQPVPEQLQTVIKNGKLVTTILEHTG